MFRKSVTMVEHLGNTETILNLPSADMCCMLKCAFLKLLTTCNTRRRRDAEAKASKNELPSGAADWKDSTHWGGSHCKCSQGNAEESHAPFSPGGFLSSAYAKLKPSRSGKLATKMRSKSGNVRNLGVMLLHYFFS